jgi:hypothetical protein
MAACSFGEVATDPHRPPVAGVQGLNRIRAANDLADLDVVVQERHKLGQAFSHSRRIAG